MYGMFVNQSRYIPYANAIVQGYKPIETRTRNMLKQLVGKCVAVIRTQDGYPAQIIGYVTIDRAEYHTADELDDMRDKTLIPPGSRYDCTGAGKWCYYLSDPEVIPAINLTEMPIRRKNRSFVEIGMPT